MIDTAPTGLFLFVGLMIAAGVWIFSVPEAQPSPPSPTAPDDAAGAKAQPPAT